MSETQGDKHPDKKITRFWAARALSAISEMRRSKKTGLFPKSEGWRNVVEHELVEAEAADVLGEKLGLSQEERRNLRTAALLHDVFKRKEIERASAIGPSAFDQAAGEQAGWIRSLGYPEEIVILIESVGHTAFKEFVTNFDSIPISRKIICYADFITLDSNIVSLAERIDYLEKRPDYKELNESGISVFGRTYFEVMREIGAKIEEEIAPKLGVSDPSSIPEFIKDCINTRITQSG